MHRLLRAYLAAGGSTIDETSPAALELTLAELCARGRHAHPHLKVEAAAFAAHVGRSGVSIGQSAGDLCVEDLYLACACLQGDSVALAHARAILGPTVERYLSRLNEARDHIEEIEQRLWEALLFGGASAPGPKLATYSGQGALASWIGVCAQRIALAMFSHERAERRARDELNAGEALLPSDPELAVLKDRFRKQFERAVETALASLPDRDKNIYRLHLIDGLTLEAVARAYSVSASTVLLWLQDARERVIEGAKRCLGEGSAISSAEFESLTRLLISQLDISISQVLGRQGLV